MQYHNLLHTFGRDANSRECPLDKGWVKTFFRVSDQAYKNYKSVRSIVDDIQVFGNKEKHMTEWYEETECTRKEGIKHYFDKHFVKAKCCSF